MNLHRVGHGNHSVQAIVLRSSTSRGGLLIAPSFTDMFGRISIGVYKNASNALTPFSLVEAEISRIDGDFALAKHVSTIDTFAEARMASEGAKTLLYIRAILEHCLPLAAPAQEAWEVAFSLLSCLTTFTDWKTAPFLLAVLFFEQEGVTQEALLSSRISDQAKHIALQALSGEKTDWATIQIPEDLFQATLELVGVNTSKIV